MVFSSFEFLGSLPFAITALVVANTLGRQFFLLVLAGLSLAFYGWFRVDYTLILIASAVGNYAIAGAVERSPRMYLLVLGIAANVLVLVAFKYLDFLMEGSNAVLGTSWMPLRIVLPLALSFITFEQISFLSDVKNKRVPRGQFTTYLAFVTVFPKLIAGPIIRYRELLPQLVAPRRISAEQLFTGLCLFCLGLFKKVALADPLGSIVDPQVKSMGTAAIAQIDAICAVLAYSLQIFFDFSAYSEMALGLAWMFGIRLPVNFFSPYRSTSIIDFWRRWHITLSAFLRDYIYIPLGGNRHGRALTSLNLLIVMSIGGLWHGAAWTFAAWGCVHGLALIANHGWRQLPWSRALPDNTLTQLGRWMLTSAVVLFGWILFRAQDFHVARNWFVSIGHGGLVPTSTTTLQLTSVAVLTLWVILLPNIPTLFGIEWDRDKIDWSTPVGIPPVPTRLTVLAAAALAISLVIMARGQHNAFIYFQF